MMQIDRLYEAVAEKGPVCVGLDTDISYLPEGFADSALTAGETEWCGAIPAGEAIPFEMPLVPALIQETFEVHASLN